LTTGAGGEKCKKKKSQADHQAEGRGKKKRCCRFRGEGRKEKKGRRRERPALWKEGKGRRGERNRRPPKGKGNQSYHEDGKKNEGTSHMNSEGRRGRTEKMVPYPEAALLGKKKRESRKKKSLSPEKGGGIKRRRFLQKGGVGGKEKGHPPRKEEICHLGKEGPREGISYQEKSLKEGKGLCFPRGGKSGLYREKTAFRKGGQQKKGQSFSFEQKMWRDWKGLYLLSSWRGGEKGG